MFPVTWTHEFQFGRILWIKEKQICHWSTWQPCKYLKLSILSHLSTLLRQNIRAPVTWKQNSSLDDNFIGLLKCNKKSKHSHSTRILHQLKFKACLFVAFNWFPKVITHSRNLLLWMGLFLMQNFTTNFKETYIWLTCNDRIFHHSGFQSFPFKVVWTSSSQILEHWPWC